MKKILTFLLTSCFWSIGAIANNASLVDEAFEKLLQLDIEQLAMVSVASKKEEHIADAPGIVTVVTAEEIKRYGARNLRDVLDRQTSLQIIGSSTLPHNKATMRGESNSQIDNTILILLNGRPLRESATSSINLDIYAFFPVESLKQIEIIRGPGSVLYGTNAFSGAINLVTKDAPDSPSGELSLSYGSFDSKQGQLTGGGKWGDLEVFGTILGLNSDGINHDNIKDGSGTTGTFKTGKEGEQLILNLKYKGLTLNTLLSETTNDNHRVAFAFPSTELQFDRQFIDIGYQHEISSKWNLAVNASYHQRQSVAVLDTVPNIAKDRTNNYLFELSSSYAPTNKLNLITGATYRLLSSEGNLSFDTNSYSFYTQADYQLYDWLKLIGGFQYNKPEMISGDFSPRIASIIQFDEHWGSKLLFGKAFHEASPAQRFTNIPGIAQGNPNLSPETIETFDAQIFYNSPNLFLAATYFHSEQEDLITRVSGPPVTAINTGGITYDGIELESKWKINERIQFIGNLSYQTNEKNDGTTDITYSPDWMIKTGISYDSDKGYQFSLFNSYFAKSTLQNHQVASVTVSNPDADGYNLLTANINMNLGHVLNNKSFSDINLSLYGDNLLDEDIYFPSISRTNVNSIPHHYQRGFYGTISVAF